jgi:hypothetical protein
MQPHSKHLAQGRPHHTVFEGLFRHERLFAALTISVLLLMMVLILTGQRPYHCETNSFDKTMGAERLLRRIAPPPVLAGTADCRSTSNWSC